MKKGGYQSLKSTQSFHRMKKGVSPIIATVLLIAIVVAMGMVVFLWLDEFIAEPVLKFEKNIELSCKDIKWNPSYSANTLYISNNGDVPIYGATIKIISDEGHSEQNLGSDESWPEEGLNQGAIFSATIPELVGANEIIIIPILLGKDTDEESQTFECGKEYGINVYKND